MHELKTIDRAIKPMLLMNLIVGTGMFENANHFFFRSLEFVYTLCYLFVFAFTFWYGSEFVNNLFSMKMFFLNRMVFKASFAANGIIMTMLILIARINAKKTRKLIKLFDEYDRIVDKIGLPTHYPTLYRYQLYNFGFSLSLIFINSTILYFWYSYSAFLDFKKMILLMIHNFPLGLISVSIISFCTWIRCLRLKLQELNGLLRSFKTTEPDLSEDKRILTIFYDFDNKRFSSFEDENVRRRKGNVTTMRIVKHAHLELIKIAEATNAAYGMQLLLLMLTAFVFLISHLYVIYRIIWLDLNTEEIVKHIVPSLFVTFFFALEIFTVSHACARTNTEAISTGDIICKLYGPYCCNEFRAEIRDFTLQLVENPFTFTACGFFTVDNSFVPKITQSIFTYLAILIQVTDMTMNMYHRMLDRSITVNVSSP